MSSQKIGQTKTFDYTNNTHLYSLPNPQMTTVITHNVLSFDERLEKNYEQEREHFVNYLMEECDYSRSVAENTDDGREAFVKEDYAMYVQTFPKVKELQQRAFKRYAQDYPDEAREMLLELNQD